MEMLYGWVRNAYEPLLYRGAFMDMVRGREMSRPGAGDRGTGHSIMQQLFRLSQLSTPTEKAYLQSLVKGHALADSQRDMIDDIPFYLIGGVPEDDGRHDRPSSPRHLPGTNFLPRWTGPYTPLRNLPWDWPCLPPALKTTKRSTEKTSKVGTSATA